MRSSTTRTWKGPTLAHSIVVDNVSAGYGAVRVLHGVSIEVNDGETVVLLGTNGNGKSTLIKCIMGIIQPMRARFISKPTASESTWQAGIPRKS